MRFCKVSGPGRSSASRWPPLLAVAVIVGCGAAVYSNSLFGPFVFDDAGSILGNPTILHLNRWREVFSPPSVGAVTVGSRPLLNFSLALNYALSGTAVWSYHALNLIIHVLAALTLFGLVRQTLRIRSPAGSKMIGAPTDTLTALAVALIWLVHPLQTEAVTYIVQRAESLMGLFYLLTLYTFARSVAANKGDVWLGLSWLACLAGMLTKEVMVSAPIIVFLYDRAFVAGSVRAAWRRHWRYYLALASTWLPLAWLVIQTGGNRGGSTGVGTGVSWLHYLASQFPALVHYLRLVAWPRPLIFYYPVYWPSWGEAGPAFAVVTLLVVIVTYALARNWALGFLGIWFFAVLAPSSLVPGAYQAVAEHRMYLALAPVIAAAVFALLRVSRPWPRAVFFAALAAAVVPLGVGTWARNQDYRSELSIWAVTAKDSPDNALAECGVGVAYAKMGDSANAEAQFNKILRRFPAFPYALVDLGNLRRAQGRRAEAIADYERGLAEKPDWPEVRVNLANVLVDENRTAEAIALDRETVRQRPLYAEAQGSLGLALAQMGDLPEAIQAYLQALRLKPDYAEANYNLANAWSAMGENQKAIARYQLALRLDPALVEAHNGLGLVWAREGRADAATEEYRLALAGKPGYAEADYNLGNLLAQRGELGSAQAAYEAALRARPDFFQAEANLANTLLGTGQAAEAISHYRKILQHHPDYADAHYNLALALRSAGRIEEAEVQAREAAALSTRKP